MYSQYNDNMILKRMFIYILLYSKTSPSALGEGRHFQISKNEFITNDPSEKELNDVPLEERKITLKEYLRKYKESL
jgi:hypothetical protein